MVAVRSLRVGDINRVPDEEFCIDVFLRMMLHFYSTVIGLGERVIDRNRIIGRVLW